MAVDNRTNWWLHQLRSRTRSEDVTQRLRPEMQLQQEFARLLQPGIGDAAILDVLPGPLTSLGNLLPNYRLSITQIEPEADHIQQEMETMGLRSRGRLVAGHPSDATQLWPDPTFDLIVCRRADLLDPTTDLAALFACLRPGGTLFLSGFMQDSGNWQFKAGTEGLEIRSNDKCRPLTLYIGSTEAEIVWSMNSAGIDGQRTWIAVEIKRRLTSRDRIERELEDFSSTSDALDELFGVRPDKSDVGFTAKFFADKPDGTSGSIMPNDALFIFTFMKMLRPKKVLEIGVSSGVSSAFMLKAAEQLGLLGESFHLDSIDLLDYVYAAPSEPVGWVVDSMAADLKPHLNLVTGVTTLDLAALRTESRIEEPDLVFLDAEHAHPWPMIDLVLLCDTLPEGVWVLMHDIGLMERAIRDQFRMKRRPNWMLRGAQWAFEFYPGEKMRGTGEWANVGAVKTTKAFRGSFAWRTLSKLPHETQITLEAEAAKTLDTEHHLRDLAAST